MSREPRDALFRTEALAARGRMSLYGPPLRDVSSATLLPWLLALVLGGALVALGAFELRQTVEGSGRLRYQGLVHVRSPTGGELSAIVKEPGSVVRREELLGQMRSGPTDRELRDAEAELAEMTRQYLRNDGIRRLDGAPGLRSRVLRARDRLAATFIRSPVDGVVVGWSVSPGETVPEGAGVATVSSTPDRMFAVGLISPTDALRFEPGARASFVADGDSSLSLDGTVRWIGREVVAWDTTVDAPHGSRSKKGVLVRIDLNAGPSLKLGGLPSGTTGTLRVALRSQSVLGAMSRRLWNFEG